VNGEFTDDAAAPAMQEWQVFHRGRPKQLITASDDEGARFFASVLLGVPLAEVTALPADYVRAREREMRQVIDREPFVFAYHEAGHAVVAHQLGAEVYSVSIVPQMTCYPGVAFADAIDSLGRMAWAGPDEDPCWAEGSRAEARQQAYVALAGLAAEFRRSGKAKWKQRRWEPDWQRVLRCVRTFVGPSGSPPAQVEIWKRRVVAMIEEQWPAVCRVGDALAAARELHEAELASLLAEPSAKKAEKETSQDVVVTALPLL
jgi:hypothetical protein